MLKDQIYKMLHQKNSKTNKHLCYERLNFIKLNSFYLGFDHCVEYAKSKKDPLSKASIPSS